MKKIIYCSLILFGFLGCSKKSQFETLKPVQLQSRPFIVPFFSIDDLNENIKITWDNNISSDSINTYLVKVGHNDMIIQVGTDTKELILKRKTAYYNKFFTLEAVTNSGQIIKIDSQKYENDYSRFFNCKNKYIAHRGLSSIYPENTAIAFEKAADNGFEYIECDIRLTKDKKWVVIHDETIDRTSDGAGKVSQFSYDELQNFNFGYTKKFSNKYPQKILSLTDFVLLCKTKNVKSLIEVKEQNLTITSIKDMMNIVNNILPYDGYLFHCTNISTLNLIRENDKKAVLGIVATNFNQVEMKDLAKLYPCFYNVGSAQISLGQPFNEFSNSNIFNLSSNGTFVSIWTVSDSKYFQNLTQNNLFLLTDIIPPIFK